MAQGQAQGQVGFFEFVGDGSNALIHGFHGAFRHEGENRRVGFDLGIPRGKYLRAAIVVGFVAIVGFGIVGGRDDHTASGAQFPHGVAEERRRQRAIAQEHLKTFRCQHTRGFTGERSGVVPRVEPHESNLLARRVALRDRGEGHGGAPHIGLVHALQPRAHDAPQAAGAKGQRL